jgi:Uma2 family endonuclease
MTAQPISGGPLYAGPDPVRQSMAQYTIADVLALPEDAPRVELRDGVMIMVPSPTIGHQNIGNLLWHWLRTWAPKEHFATTAVGVAVTDSDTFEPDVLLMRSRPSTSDHFVAADQVLIALEVVARGTRRRDRFEKPADYAAAGIPHYWRVEQDPVHVYAYELGEDGTYRLAAESETELVLERPFEIRLTIADITP